MGFFDDDSEELDKESKKEYSDIRVTGLWENKTSNGHTYLTAKVNHHFTLSSGDYIRIFKAKNVPTDKHPVAYFVIAKLKR